MKATVSDEGQPLDGPQLNEAWQPPSRQPEGQVKRGSPPWLVPALLVLSAIPLVAGFYRLTQLAGGVEVTPANARFLAAPVPVVLHIVSAAAYAILGAFQFAAGFRRRYLGWHRVAGRPLVVCGLVVELSGLWMTLFYPWPDGDGVLLYAFRLMFGSGMVASIVLGFATIRRGQVQRHRAWMARAYALGLGAGTQVLSLATGELIIGPPSELSRALLMGLAWLINLLVVEWAIRRRPSGVPSGRATGVIATLCICGLIIGVAID